MAATWDYIMKFVVVGDSGTGKSSILVQLTDQRFLAQSDPTIGVEFGASLIPLPDGKTIKAQVWDTAGQESFRSITRSYYRGASGALLVFDTTHRPSFTSLRGWLDDLKSYGDEKLVILLVGNKADLCSKSMSQRKPPSKPSSTTQNDDTLPDPTNSSSAAEDESIPSRSTHDDQRQVTLEEATSFAQEHGLQYLETSAKTGLNVEEAFATVARTIHASGGLDGTRSNGQGSGGRSTGGMTVGGSSFPLTLGGRNRRGGVAGCC